jgi:hypothetical protein
MEKTRNRQIEEEKIEEKKIVYRKEKR